VPQLDRVALVGEIVRAVRDYTETQMQVTAEDLDDRTPLVGEDAVLDSHGLVSVILDVEQTVNATTGAAISITDERAMSQQRSPFRTVGSLADYILAIVSAHPGR
jgi:acyl carrier protein